METTNVILAEAINGFGDFLVNEDGLSLTSANNEIESLNLKSKDQLEALNVENYVVKNSAFRETKDVLECKEAAKAKQTSYESKSKEEVSKVKSSVQEIQNVSIRKSVLGTNRKV